jgi:hypothetical protein
MHLRVGERAKVIMAILVGCLFVGLAMGLRECSHNMWVRASIAAVGAAAGLGIATILTRRSTKKK